jgi:hypothetical protein
MTDVSEGTPGWEYFDAAVTRDLVQAGYDNFHIGILVRGR